MKWVLVAILGLVTGALLVLGWHNLSAIEIQSGIVSTEIPPDAVEIIMNDTGYVPSTITVPLGTSVAFVTSQSGDAWPASNIHPTHGIYPEFDPGSKLKPGQVWIFTFDKPGTWRFHDHLQPAITGTITVE